MAQRYHGTGSLTLIKVPLYAKVRLDADKVVAERVHRGVNILKQYRRAQTLSNTLRKHIRSPNGFLHHQVCAQQWAALQSHINDVDHCLTTQLASFLTSDDTLDQRFAVSDTLLAQHLLQIHK